MVARVTSSRFVGRDGELAELAGLLDRAADGDPRLAFITGESGMGKTRLVDEFARHAREQGARILSGECVELGESELPYAPIVSALRPLARARDPVLEGLDPALGELAGLLGAGADGGAANGRDAAGGGAVQGRTTVGTLIAPQARLFEALLALLDQLGAEQPVVLVVEDIHWADRSTRDFLVFLSRALCRERVLVAATYRSDDLHRRHPLRPVLAELERSERAVRIPLAAFTRAELAEQLESILGAPPADALVDRLLARSEGNPLFAEELLAAGADGLGDLPPTLRDALMVRVEALSRDAQELLRVVAAGQRVEHAVLRAVSGIDGRALRDALREAAGQRLLEVDEEGRYGFRHALLREAVHDDLLPGEHAELHAALAEALEQEARDPAPLETLTEIAHHWTSAGERERAFDASLRAAAAAEAVHANGEAAALLERALELWEHVPDAEVRSGADHVELLRRTAVAHNRAADHPRMRTVLRQALAEVDREAEPARAALLLERLGRAEWELGHGAEALRLYDQALALLGDETSPERAIVLAAQGGGLMLSGRYEESAAVCRAAIAAARATGERAAEDHALNTLGVCLGALGDAAGGEEALRAAMAIARADDRRGDVSRAYVNLSDMLFLSGQARRARAVAHEGLAELGGNACRWLALQLVEVEFHLGDWQAADRLLAAHGGTRIGNVRVLELLGHAELALARGDHVRAIELLEEARDRAKRSPEPQWHGPIAALLTQAYRRAGRWDDARRAVDEGLDRVRPDISQDRLRRTRIAAAGVATEADRAQHARDLGRDEDAEEAAGRAARLLAVARDAAAAPSAAPQSLAVAHLLDAEAEALRAAGGPDPAAYARAAQAWDALERPYAAALARRRQAEALASRGDRDAAAEVAAAARASAERLGAGWLVAELDALARRARLRIADDDGRQAEPDEDDTAHPGDDLGLTPRERDVLALLAEGRTNREIGEALFMAEKTASVHVSRILAKLGVRSRTEAAAVAHRLGLAA